MLKLTAHFVEIAYFAEIAKIAEIVKLTEIPLMGGQGGESVQCLNSESDTQYSQEEEDENSETDTPYVLILIVKVKLNVPDGTVWLQIPNEYQIYYVLAKKGELYNSSYATYKRCLSWPCGSVITEKVSLMR